MQHGGAGWFAKSEAVGHGLAASIQLPVQESRVNMQITLMVSRTSIDNTQ